MRCTPEASEAPISAHPPLPLVPLTQWWRRGQPTADAEIKRHCSRSRPRSPDHRHKKHRARSPRSDRRCSRSRSRSPHRGNWERDSQKGEYWHNPYPVYSYLTYMTPQSPHSLLPTPNTPPTPHPFYHSPPDLAHPAPNSVHPPKKILVKLYDALCQQFTSLLPEAESSEVPMEGPHDFIQRHPVSDTVTSGVIT